MTISTVAKNQLISRIAHSLRVPNSQSITEITIQLVAQALRRAACIKAPCSKKELECAVVASLEKLGMDKSELEILISNTLENLLVYGEIIEIKAELNDPWNPGRFVIRPGPPAFVVRQDKSIIVLGVAGDEITPLTDNLNARLHHRGVLRIISGQEPENVPEMLTETGLIELSEKSWLRIPEKMTFDDYLSRWSSLLRPMSGSIEELKIIDTKESPTFYAKRWTEPKVSHNGLYVGRRPQKYGAMIWCLLELKDGQPKKMVDLTSKGDRERHCDIAWRIQMANDANVGLPQCVQITNNPESIRFFSPLPSWAERKLSVIGNKETSPGCLFSYQINPLDKDSTIRFLRDYLWIEEAN